MNMERRLYRSRTDRMIFGVCGGLADYFDVDPTLVRIAFVVLAFLHGIGVLAYIIMAIVVPQEGTAATRSSDVVKENLEDMGRSASEFGEDLRSRFGQPEYEQQEYRRRRERRRYMFGIILILIGILFLTTNLGLLWWINFNLIWPLILVVIGLLLLLRNWR